MTAPALPGAAPDPARLPPEVPVIGVVSSPNSAWRGGMKHTVVMDGTSLASSCDRESAQFAVEIARLAIARALGGDGEPVGPDAKSMIEAIRLIGVALGQDDDWVDCSPALVEFAAERIRSLYTRPAATGDTGEVEKARAAFYEAAREAQEIAVEAASQMPLSGEEQAAVAEARKKRSDTYRALIKAERAATGGPDAR